jgi:hypothetical protein
VLVDMPTCATVCSQDRVSRALRPRSARQHRAICNNLARHSRPRRAVRALRARRAHAVRSPTTRSRAPLSLGTTHV